MNIKFICTRMCGKADFEELRKCKYRSGNGTGLKECTKKSFILSTLLREYETIYSFRTVHILPAYEKTLDIEYRCNKCQTDWANCENRKGDYCHNLVSESLKEEITKLSNVFEDEEKYNYAHEIFEQIRQELIEEYGIFQNPYYVSWNKIKDMSRDEIKELYTDNLNKACENYRRRKGYRKP